MTNQKKMSQITFEAIKAKNILKVKDVAFLMGVGSGWIYKLVERRKIPHYKRGKCVSFKRDEVERWMVGERVYTDEERLRIAQTTLMKGGKL